MASNNNNQSAEERYDKIFGSNLKIKDGGSPGSLWLEDYDHPLPKSLTTIGPLFLGGYDHPLPDSLKTINGYLCLEDYKHPLPEGLTTINSDLFLSNYKHRLPGSLKTIRGNIHLYNYNQPLPEDLTVEGEVHVGHYDLTKHKLPGNLAVKVFMKWGLSRNC